jgi:hypothetical protein
MSLPMCADRLCLAARIGCRTRRTCRLLLLLLTASPVEQDNIVHGCGLLGPGVPLGLRCFGVPATDQSVLQRRLLLVVCLFAGRSKLKGVSFETWKAASVRHCALDAWRAGTSLSRSRFFRTFLLHAFLWGLFHAGLFAYLLVG